MREYLEKNYAETSGDDTVKLALCALLEVCVFSLLSLCDPCTDKIKMRLRVKAKAKHLLHPSLCLPGPAQHNSPRPLRIGPDPFLVEGRSLPAFSIITC